MFGALTGRHVYVTVPRVLADLIVGSAEETDPPVPEPGLLQIHDYLRDWRVHPDVSDQTWTSPSERVKVAARLRFLLWAVRNGRISDGRP